MDDRSSRRIKLIISSVTGGLLFIGLVWYASPSRILATLESVDFRLIGVAWLLMLVATAFRTVRFSFFVSIKGNVLRAYAVFALARLLNLAMPFRTGDVAMLAVLKRARIARSIAHVLPVWLMLRVTDALALALWFTVVIGFSAIGQQYFPAGIAIVVVSFFVVLFFNYFVGLLPTRALENRNSWFMSRMLAVIAGFEAADGLVKRIAASLVALFIWGLLLASAVLSQMAFNAPVDFASSLLVAVLVFGLSVLPLNAPLGVGTGEVLWSTAMVIAGVPLDVAIPLAIGIRLASLCILFIEGAMGSSLLIFLDKSGSANTGDEEPAQT